MIHLKAGLNPSIPILHENINRNRPTISTLKEPNYPDVIAITNFDVKATL